MNINKILNGLSFGILIIILLVIIYNPITSLGFATMDDNWMLLGDKLVHPPAFNLHYLVVLFTTFNSVQYSPVNTLYYHFIFLINGYDPYWYHLSSLLIHLINTGLVFLFTKEILRLFKIETASLIAALCALIWTIHPLNVESVIWVSASKVPLYTMFTLIALLSMLHFAVYKKKLYYINSLLTFAIACFCKEQAVIMPLTLVIFLLIFHISKTGVSIKYWIALCIPFFLVALFFGYITVIAQQEAYGEQEAASLYGLWDRFIFSFYCLCFYLLNTFIPVNLHYQYNYPIKPGETLPAILYIFPIAFLSIVSFCFYFLKDRSKSLIYLFFFLFFLTNISLCVQIVPLRRPAIMADRYMYLPVLGLIILMVVFIEHYFKHSRLKKSFFFKAVLVGGGLTYIISLIIISSQLAETWQQHNINIK